MVEKENKCPHKKIVKENALSFRSNWYCKWCGQKFVPATRECADAVIKEAIEWEEFNKRGSVEEP